MKKQRTVNILSIITFMTAICIAFFNRVIIVFGESPSLNDFHIKYSIMHSPLYNLLYAVGTAFFILFSIIIGWKYYKVTRRTDIPSINLNLDNFKTILHNMGSGLVATDTAGRISYINPTTEQLTGYTLDEVKLRSICDIIALYQAEVLLSEDQILYDNNILNVDLLSRNNQKYNVTVTINNIYNDHNTHLGYILVITDVTSSKQEEYSLRENEEKYRSLFHQAEYPIFILDKSRVIDCNSKVVELFKCKRENIVGKSLMELTSTDEIDTDYLKKQLNTRISEALNGAPQYFEWILKCCDNTTTIVEISFKKLTLENVDIIQATIYDVSDKNYSIESIKLKVSYDSLTGLPSRKLFYDHVNKSVAASEAVGQKLAILFIDLDLFKSINDTLGHVIGDALLQQTALRLKNIIDRNDDIVARMGGDEFAVLLHDTNSEQAAIDTANTILTVLCEPFIIQDQEILVSASIGIAIYPGHGRDTHSILKNAASSMYKAKELGRNNYQLYTPDINENTVEKFNMQKDLRRALKRNELLLHYQPKVDGKTRKLVGMEALVRWQHPEKGLIYPIEFIPLAEETGIIKHIDEWVLRTACNQLKKWMNKGHSSLRLAVNLSAWQFKEQHLAKIVANVLEETNISPSDLELEITETAAMENLDFTVNTLSKLMAMGVNISIDDFGTGYSSLNYLKHFPINFLKIDRTFVADIIDDKNTYAIIKAIIEVAHTLNLKVIAEGVETQQQLELLQGMGCDEIQGFYISKPLPVDEIEKQME